MRPILLLALLAACAAPRPPCPVAPVATQGAPFLWHASKGGPAIWLYGTIHDAGLDAVPAVALDALSHSARLVTEIGDVTPDPDEFRELVRIAHGKGIDQLLPADDWWELRDALLGTIKEDQLRRVRPWYAMSLLSNTLAPARGPSMDVELAARAKQLAIPVEALETWQAQLAALDHAVGVADLQQAIHARASMRCSLARLVTAYRAGDIATMQALLVVPRTADTLLTARNRAWLPAIEKDLAHGGAFVAVGLGHLLGDEGLVAMLERAGYSVERVAR